MQLFKNPFQIATNFPGLVEILLTDQQPSSLWEVAVSQTFDGTYTTLHAFNPTGVQRPPLRGSVGFKEPGITNAQLAPISGQSTGLRRGAASWILDRAGLVAPATLTQDAQHFMRLRRFDPVTARSGTGTSPGVGTTYNDSDAGLDYAALGVLAGDLLIITSGPEAGEFLIDTPGVGTLTLDGGTALSGASAADDYEIVRPEVFGGGLNRNFLIPRPYWHHAPKPVLIVNSVAPDGANVAEAEVLVLPQTCQFMTIQNLNAPAGDSLFFATDDDGPEIELIAGDRMENLDVSAHLITLRGDGGTAPFNLILTFGEG